MSNQKITHLADKTYSKDAVNLKQFLSLDDKYVKQQGNMVDGLAVGYANMMAMLVLNIDHLLFFQVMWSFYN